MEREFLPRIGMIISEGETDICAAFLWLTDSKIAIMEMFISNPDVRGPVRNEALDVLVTSLKSTARRLGYGAVYTTTDHKHVIHRLEKDGFHRSKDNIVSLMGRL